jgi:hypothetical protein
MGPVVTIWMSAIWLSLATTTWNARISLLDTDADHVQLDSLEVGEAKE